MAKTATAKKATRTRRSKKSAAATDYSALGASSVVSAAGAAAVSYTHLILHPISFHKKASCSHPELVKDL